MTNQRIDQRILKKLGDLFPERNISSIQTRLSQLCRERGIPRGAAAEIMARQRRSTVWRWLDENSRKCFRESMIEVKRTIGKSEDLKVKDLDPFKIPLSQFNIFPDLARECKIKKPYSKEINYAILNLEEFMKEKMGLDDSVYGIKLVDEAWKKGVFKRKNPGEEQGLSFLFRAAILWLRNSGGHKKRGATKEDCLQIILFTDYLIRLFSDIYDRNILKKQI